MRLCCEQLGLDHLQFGDYGERDQIRRKHIIEIQTALGLRPLTHSMYREIAAWLLPTALATDDGSTLVAAVLEEMRTRRIACPPLPTIERLGSTVRARARRQLWRRLADGLTDPQRRGLDQLLDVRSGGGQSTLAWLRQTAYAATTGKKLQVDLNELEAREWLAGVKADEHQQIERFKIVAELKDCEKGLKTSAITAKSTELTELFVAQAFKKRFKDEVDGLQLATLDVVMEPVRGKKGVTNFGLRLVKASNAKVADIASEGERRRIALSAFMAELSQASHQSARVFDDPVSSLDHSYRERIAKLLVDEAPMRQVIVFSHDEIFANDLLSFADTAKATKFVLRIE